jgi:hypothetical protein
MNINYVISIGNAYMIWPMIAWPIAFSGFTQLHDFILNHNYLSENTLAKLLKLFQCIFKQQKIER